MAAITSSADEPSLELAAVPPLAWLAGAAALADLLINRVLVLLGSELWATETLVTLDRWGGFARNLSVVSALVALSFCLASLSSARSDLPFSARTAISSFGWVLVPILALMTFLPLELTRVELVLVVAGLAHALILLLVLAGVQRHSTRPLGAALLLSLVAALSGMASLVVTLFGGRTYWEHTERLSNAFRWSGELAYLAVPVAIGIAIAIPSRTPRGRAALVLSGLAAALVAAGMAVWKRAAGAELPNLMYGAMRFDFLPDDSVVLYAIPLGIGSAVTVAAMLSKDLVQRQLGAALLLLLTAGYAPRSPSTLLMTVLGVALLSRSAIATSQRQRGS